jgi:MFS superfamily sulfate permease-like transporter
VVLIIMVLMPRFTKVIPAPLVAIVLITLATVTIAIAVPTVGDQGELPRSLAELFIPNDPLTWETLSSIGPFALAMALVGLLESLLTAKLVDEIIVAASTVNWHSVQLSTLKRMPLSETIVMVATVVVVVATHKLAIGVLVGVVVAMVAFARRVSHFATVKRTLPEVETVPTAYYRVNGELFFASSNDLTTQFEYSDDPDRVIIDMSHSHIGDASTVAALDAIITKYQRHRKRVILIGINETSQYMHEPSRR